MICPWFGVCLFAEAGSRCKRHQCSFGTLFLIRWVQFLVTGLNCSWAPNEVWKINIVPLGFLFYPSGYRKLPLLWHWGFICHEPRNTGQLAKRESCNWAFLLSLFHSSLWNPHRNNNYTGKYHSNCRERMNLLLLLAEFGLSWTKFTGIGTWQKQRTMQITKCGS